MGVVTYYSVKLSDTQRVYCNPKCELLGIVIGLKSFEKYLSVAGTPVFLYTDHAALLPMLTSRHLPALYIRWLNRITRYMVTFRDLAGRAQFVDYLRRMIRVARGLHSETP